MSSSSIRRWLRRTRIFTGRISRVVYYDEFSDLPDVPRPNELAVAGSPDRAKWALLDCPCGRGHTILLTLSTIDTPHWTVSLDPRDQPTLSPSVDRNRDKPDRCHFWLRSGEIHWV